MQTDGVCVEDLWKYSISKILAKPSDEAHADAKKRFLVDYYKILTNGTVDLVDEIKCLLTQGIPVAVMMYVGKDFFKGKMPHQEAQETDSRVGWYNHAVNIVGFINDEKVFIGRNSYGPLFVIKGHFLVPFDYLIVGSQYYNNDHKKHNFIREVSYVVSVKSMEHQAKTTKVTDKENMLIVIGKNKIEYIDMQTKELYEVPISEDEKTDYAILEDLKKCTITILHDLISLSVKRLQECAIIVQGIREHAILICCTGLSLRQTKV